MTVKSEIISGTSPIQLNAKGRSQAEDLGHKIAKAGGMHIVVSSDLPRAHETAKIIGKASGVGVQTTKGLHPWHLGEIEGKPEAESEAIVQHHAKAMPWAPLPGKSSESGIRGESFNSFKDRLKGSLDALQNAAAGHPDRRLGAVTHSRTIHLARALEKGKGEPDMEEFFRKPAPEGHIFLMHKDGLMPMDNEPHLPPGAYLIRHTATDHDKQ